MIKKQLSGSGPVVLLTAAVSSVILGSALLSSASLAQPQASQSQPVRIEVELGETARCVGNLAGFRNVPVQCVVGADNYLTDCRVTTSARDVLRRQSRFICMAQTMRAFDAAGQPIPGRTVDVVLNLPSTASATRRTPRSQPVIPWAARTVD